MLDINSIKTTATFDLELVDPVSGKPTGAFITLAGHEHPKRKAMIFKRQRELRALMQKKGGLRNLDADPEEVEAERLDELAACTLGWRGIGEDGKALEFSEQKAAELYAKPDLSWLADQVQRGLNDNANFIESSVKPLIEYAVAVQRLATPQSDGRPLRDHLLAVARQSREPPPELALPPLPAAGEALLAVYTQLANATGSNGFGRNPVSWQDIASWQQLMHVDLSPWEIDTLIEMDRAVMAQTNSTREKTNGH